MINVSHKSKFKRYFIYPITGVLANIIYFTIRAIPFKVSSAIGARIARAIGQFLKVNKTVISNLKLAFPEKNEKEINDIAIKVWDNLGRTFFEFPCMEYLETHREMVDIKPYEKKTNHQKPRIYFAGHLANWELLSYVGHSVSKKLGFVYRPFNNPYMNNLMKMRANHYEQEAIEKGPMGVRNLANHLKSGDDIIILMDQRLGEGVKIKFFGHDAMAVSSVARLALKYDAEIFSIFIKRVEKTNFEVNIAKMDLSELKGETEHEKVIEITQKTSDLLEAEIRKYPEQWFWVHNRWKM